jgi:hypothetical protein
MLNRLSRPNRTRNITWAHVTWGQCVPGLNQPSNCVGYNKLPFHKPDLVDCTGLCVYVCVREPSGDTNSTHLNMTGRSTTARKSKKIQVLLHDNAWLQTSLSTREAVATVGWTVPPSSSLQSRFRKPRLPLFGPPKDAFWGLRFTEEDELKHSVREELRRFSKEFYATGTQRSMHKWRNCVNNKGYFVEK